MLLDSLSLENTSTGRGDANSLEIGLQFMWSQVTWRGVLGL